MARERINIDRAKMTIRESTTIATYSDVRRYFLENSMISSRIREAGGDPDKIIAKLVSADLRANIASYPPLQDFLNRAIREVGSSPALRELVGDLSFDVNPPGGNLLKRRPNLVGYDPDFTDIDDTLPIAIEEILKDPDLSRELMKQLDGKVEQSTQDLMREIDEKAEVGKRVRKKIAIVGGGPLTSLAVGVLGPYVGDELVVISQDERIGSLWRGLGLFKNSSTEIKRLSDAALPLTDNTTTPISPGGMGNFVFPGDLLSQFDLRVSCDDGSDRKYISGLTYAKAVVTNIALHTKHFLTHNEVNPQETIITRDGMKILRVTDVNTGEEREIEAEVVIYINGVGEEFCPFSDEESQELYASEVVAKQEEIIRARNEIKSIQAELESLGADDKSEKKKARLITRLKKIRVNAPRLLPWTIVWKLLDFWINDLGSDPDRYPFQGVAGNIGIAGGADSAFTLSEFFEGAGPVDAYPDIPRLNAVTNILHYNLGVTTPQEFSDEFRLRYSRVWSGRNEGLIETNPNKIASWEGVRDRRGKLRGVRVTDAQGDVEQFSYFSPALGFRRVPIEDTFVSPRRIGDTSNNKIALGELAGQYVVGAGAGFRGGTFPDDINKIIEALNIKVNTVSAWANAPEVERLMWTLISGGELNNSHIRDLVNQINSGDTDLVLDDVRKVSQLNAQRREQIRDEETLQIFSAPRRGRREFLSRDFLLDGYVTQPLTIEGAVDEPEYLTLQFDKKRFAVRLTGEDMGEIICFDGQGISIQPSFGDLRRFQTDIVVSGGELRVSLEDRAATVYKDQAVAVTNGCVTYQIDGKRYVFSTTYRVLSIIGGGQFTVNATREDQAFFAEAVSNSGNEAAKKMYFG